MAGTFLELAKLFQGLFPAPLIVCQLRQPLRGIVCLPDKTKRFKLCMAGGRQGAKAVEEALALNPAGQRRILRPIRKDIAMAVVLLELAHLFEQLGPALFIVLLMCGSEPAGLTPFETHGGQSRHPLRTEHAFLAELPLDMNPVPQGFVLLPFRGHTGVAEASLEGEQFGEALLPLFLPGRIVGLPDEPDSFELLLPVGLKPALVVVLALAVDPLGQSAILRPVGWHMTMRPLSWVALPGTSALE